MKRLSKIMAILLVMGILMMGCSSKTVTFNAEGFTNDVSALELEDQLVKIPEKTAETFYDLTTEGIKSYTLYGSGTRATASEVMVVEVTDPKHVDAVKKMLEQRRADLTKEYQDYIPGEVARIEGAVVETRGNHVILAITGANDKITALLDQYTTEK